MELRHHKLSLDFLFLIFAKLPTLSHLGHMATLSLSVISSIALPD